MKDKETNWMTRYANCRKLSSKADIPVQYYSETIKYEYGSIK